MKQLFANAFSNWKTTSAGIVLISNGLYQLIDAIQSHTLTQERMEHCVISICGGIGLVAAGDAGKSHELVDLQNKVAVLHQAVQTGDTSMLKKSDLPKP